MHLGETGLDVWLRLRDKLSVFVFAVQWVSYVHTDDRVRRQYDCSTLAHSLCFVSFLFPASETLNNLQGVWLLILPSLWDKTGGLLPSLVVSHTVRKRKSDILKGAGKGIILFPSSGFRAVAYFSGGKKDSARLWVLFDWLSTIPCSSLAGEMSICSPALILPLCMAQCDFG